VVDVQPAAVYDAISKHISRMAAAAGSVPQMAGCFHAAEVTSLLTFRLMGQSSACM
jgi:hypothetical protein